MFNEKLRSLRQVRGLSQSDLADRLGVDQSCVARWELGHRQPKLRDIGRIARVLNAGVYDLIGTGVVLPGGDIYSTDNSGRSGKIPLFLCRVSAGFPSPADDYIEKKLNLHELLVENESATFFVKVQGNSMIGARIHDGDVLVVDRAREVRSGSVVIAVLDGELTVKRVSKNKGKLYLMPENPVFQPIEVTREQDLTIWGVVTSVIHSIK